MIFNQSLSIASTGHLFQFNTNFMQDLYSRLSGFNASIDPESLIYILSTEHELELPDKKFWSDYRVFDQTVPTCLNTSIENSKFFQNNITTSCATWLCSCPSALL
jgi:hypothetical protein